MESWKRTLYLSWAILFSIAAGLGMFMPFLPLYVKDLGVTDPRAQSLWSGVLYGVAYFATAMLAPLWGTISDKYGRKPLILRTTLGISVIALLMSLVTNVYQLLVLRILHGMCGGTMPAFVALVAFSLPKDKIGQGLGTMQTALLGGNIVGPSIGGVLADWMGYRNVLLVMSFLMFVAGMLTLFFIHEPARDPAKARDRVFHNIKFVISSPNLRIVALALFTTQFSLYIMEPILPLFIVSLHSAGNSATLVGLVISITGFATMLFAPYRGNAGDRKGHRNVLARSMFATGVVYMPQALVTSAYQLMPLRAVIGFFIAGIEPSAQSVIVKNTTDSQRGGVLGITHSVRLCGMAIGPFIGGSLGAVFGLRFPFVLTSLLLMSLSYFLMRQIKRIDA